MTAAEFELLKATHDKVDAMAQTLAAHLAVHEATGKRTRARGVWLAVAAAWAAVAVGFVQIFVHR